MHLLIHKKYKIAVRLISVLLLIIFAQPVWAAGPPAPSIFSSPLAIALIVLMIILLIIIAILANVLLGAADFKLQKRKKEKTEQPVLTSLLILAFLLAAPSLLAQDITADKVQTVAKTIGDMPASTFYIIATIIFLELLVIITLVINIKSLLAVTKEKIVAKTEAEIITIKKSQLSWWDRFNKLRPATQEAELDLGHEYDGIRELNNRLPPWWLYGFYLTIIIACVYMWRYHVSHTAPLSAQEYERSVQIADMHIKEYLKQKGENINETSVSLLTAVEDIQAGKAIFSDPSRCMTCHGPEGGGNAIGPNLTDDYWIYGGNIKDLFKTIKYGTNKGMRSWKDDLSAKQIAQVASYIKSLHGTKPSNPKPLQGELYKEEALPAAHADSTIVKSN